MGLTSKPAQLTRRHSVRLAMGATTMGLFEWLGLGAAQAHGASSRAPDMPSPDKVFEGPALDLLKAALAGNEAGMRQTIAQGASPNAQGPRSTSKATPQLTLLHYAVGVRNAQALALLVAAGANPLFDPRPEDSSALAFPIVRGDAAMLDAFLRIWPLSKVPEDQQSLMASSSGNLVNLLDESIPAFRGGESVTLAGKHFLDVPEPRTFIGQGSFDWLAEQHRKLIELVDPSWPVDVQLRLLEKGYETIRAAAQAGLIDSKVVASFAEKTFRPSVKQLTEMVQTKLRKSGVPHSGDALKKEVLVEMRKPVVGCFVAGTLVHTKDGLKPIEQIKVGDWVLSRPENPEEGTETAYKRVAQTFRFENKPVVKFDWFQRPVDDPTGEKYNDRSVKYNAVFVTPNHPVWVDGHGWVAVERLHEPGKRQSFLRGDEWGHPSLRLVDGSACHIGDVNECFLTDQSQVVYTDYMSEFLLYGHLWDFTVSPPKKISTSLVAYEDDWSDSEADEPVVFATTVYNIEVEDWHTYFVGSTGLWVHNTDCNRFEEDLLAFAGAKQLGEQELKTLVAGALEYRGKATNGKTFTQFQEAELKAVLKEMKSEDIKGFTFVKVPGAGKYVKERVGSENVTEKALFFEDHGPGRMATKEGLRVEYAVLRDNSILERMLVNKDLEESTIKRLLKTAYARFENSYTTPTGQRVFVDRKWNATSMVGEREFKPLDQLFRWALNAETNPSYRFLLEISNENPGALAAYNKLIEKIKNSTSFEAIVERDGTVVLTEKEVEFFYGNRESKCGFLNDLKVVCEPGDE